MTSPTYVLHNAHIITMAPANAKANALAGRDGAVVAVGTAIDVMRVAGPDAATWDAAGATVLPGFIDAHQHPALAAIYGGSSRLVPPRVTDIASLQRTLAEAAAAAPDEPWILATDWDELLLSERRPPTRAELDDAVPDRPLFALHYTCHRAVANSRALELAGIGKGTPDPTGGIISRGRGGTPDGLLIERAMGPVEALARADRVSRDAEGFITRLARHHDELVRMGITRVVDALVPLDLIPLYREASRRGLLRVPTVMMPGAAGGYLEAPWEVLDGPTKADGDELLSVGPIKLVFDGASACAMCLGWWQASAAFMKTLAIAVAERSLDPLRVALSARPRVGLRFETGIQLFHHEEATKIVAAAAARGFAVAIHAEGNAAVDVALSAYEAAGSALTRGGMPRIEHGIFLDRRLVARIVDVGAAVVTQPAFMNLPAYASVPAIPSLRTSPLRWLLDAGCRVAASSDFPCASLNPLDGMRAAITRRTARGNVHEPDQRVSLDEALAMYTRDAADVCGSLDRCGTLETGKRADVVVLDGRLTERALEDGLRVAATVIGGNIAVGPNGLAAAPFR